MDDDVVVAKLDQIWRAHVESNPKEQLASWRQREPDVEIRFTVDTPISNDVLHTLCERFELKPFRRRGTRHSTACLVAPEGFMSSVFAPVFQEMCVVLEGAALQMARRLVARWEGEKETAR